MPSLVFIQIEGENAEGEAGFGLGSGVIVNEAGDILTAHHVVAGATKIEVNFSDGSQSAAEVIAAEPGNDIAVLRPEQPPEIIVPAVLASLAGMRVGDEAYAVGNPGGGNAFGRVFKRDVKASPKDLFEVLQAFGCIVGLRVAQGDQFLSVGLRQVERAGSLRVVSQGQGAGQAFLQGICRVGGEVDEH